MVYAEQQPSGYLLYTGHFDRLPQKQLSGRVTNMLTYNCRDILTDRICRDVYESRMMDYSFDYMS